MNSILARCTILVLSDIQALEQTVLEMKNWFANVDVLLSHTDHGNAQSASP